MSFIKKLFGSPKEPKVIAARSSEPHWSERNLDAMPEDYLGKAATAKHAAKQAIKEKRFNDAWRLLNEQQKHWIDHANREGFTKRQTLNLLASINEQMANIHRLEGRHHDALAQLIYAIGSDSRPPESRIKKLSAYFNRCKFDSRYSVKRAEMGVKMIRKEPDIKLAQELVTSLREGSAPTGK